MQKPHKKNPHIGHRERMRERFCASGFDNYRAHEVLETMLFNALPRVNTNEIAHKLLLDRDSIFDLLYAPADEHMAVSGIGKQSAQYIASLIPRMSEIIISHFRDRGELSIYDIAFLSDWFLRYKDSDTIGIIICDEENNFVEFRYLIPYLEDGEFDPYETGDMIAKNLSARRYYIISKCENKIINRDNLLILRDYTSRLNSFMSDAYGIEGFRPVSYIYKNQK